MINNKTKTQIIETTVVTKVFTVVAILAFILVSLTCFSISANALENDDVLVNGSGMYLTTGDHWPFYQGYELIFKGLSSSQEGNKVWIELLLNSESMDNTVIHEGEYFIYTRNSKEIFNITVDTIYSGSDGGLATFKPVYQYLDPTLPEPDMAQDHDMIDNSNGSANNSDLTNDDMIENASGFDAMLLFLCISATVIFVRQKR